MTYHTIDLVEKERKTAAVRDCFVLLCELIVLKCFWQHSFAAFFRKLHALDLSAKRRVFITFVQYIYAIVIRFFLDKKIWQHCS